MTRDEFIKELKITIKTLDSDLIRKDITHVPSRTTIQIFSNMKEINKKSIEAVDKLIGMIKPPIEEDGDI